MGRQPTTHLLSSCMFADQSDSCSGGYAVQISARRREKVPNLRSLRRRRFRKLATAPRVRFSGNTGEPDAPGRRKSQRSTLHRQFRCRFPGGGAESVTQSGCAVHFVRAQYSRPESPATLTPDQSLRNLRDRGTGCGFVKMEIEVWRVRSPS